MPTQICFALHKGTRPPTSGAVHGLDIAAARRTFRPATLFDPLPEGCTVPPFDVKHREMR